MNHRIAWLIMQTFPPSFRQRYGSELATLVRDVGASPRVIVDLAFTSARAWMRPAFTGAPLEKQRLRIQSTVGTGFVAWSATVVAIAGFGRALNDPPLFSPGSATSALFHVTIALGIVMTAMAAMCAGVYSLTVLWPAIRRGRRELWQPAVAPILYVSIWGIATLIVAAIWQPGITPMNKPLAVIAILLYMPFTLLAVAACVISASVAIRRARLTTAQLKPAFVAVALGSAVLILDAIMSGLTAGFVLAQHHLSPFDVSVIVGPPSILFAAAVSASVSTVRGLRAL